MFCNEINNEIHKSLKQKENIQYMIVSLKKEFKIQLQVGFKNKI